MSDFDDIPTVDPSVQDIVDSMNEVSIDAPPLPESSKNVFQDDNVDTDNVEVAKTSQIESITRRASELKSKIVDSAKKGIEVGRQYTGKKYSEVKGKVLEGFQKGKELTKKNYETAKTKAAEKYKEAKEGINKAVEKVGEKLQPLSDKMSDAKNWSKEKVAEMRRIAKEKFPKYFDLKLDSDLQLFQDRLVEGAEPIELSAGQVWQLPFRVNAGDTIRWDFSCLKFDIFFKIALRTMAIGGAVEEELRSLCKYKCGKRHLGSYTAYKSGQIMLIWDNSHSWIRSKHLVYSVEHIQATKDMKATVESEAEKLNETIEEIQNIGEKKEASIEVAAKQDEDVAENNDETVQEDKKEDEGVSPTQGVKDEGTAENVEEEENPSYVGEMTNTSD